MRDYIKKANILFDEREAIKSISNILREKDIQILNLKNHLKEISELEKVKNSEIDNLSRIGEKQSEIINSK